LSGLDRIRKAARNKMGSIMRYLTRGRSRMRWSFVYGYVELYITVLM
jgi:hypothetical protein